MERNMEQKRVDGITYLFIEMRVSEAALVSQ